MTKLEMDIVFAPLKDYEKDEKKSVLKLKHGKKRKSSQNATYSRKTRRNTAKLRKNMKSENLL